MTSKFQNVCDFFLLFLEESPQFKDKIFLIGGAVRDSFLNIESTHLDIDITVEHKDGAHDLAFALHRLFPSNITIPFQIGQGYPIWKIKFNSPLIIKNKTFDFTGFEFDFADTQKECFPDPLTRQRITEFGTFTEDIFRRDFTINMLAFDLTRGLLIDPSGFSINDLTHGKIQTHPHLDGKKILNDDPLRIIRALRFSAVLNFTISETTKKDLKICAPRLEIVSVERILSEWSKTIAKGSWTKLLRLTLDLGLFAFFFPHINEEFIPWTQLSDFKNTLYDQFLIFLYGQSPVTVEDYLKSLKWDQTSIKKIKKAHLALQKNPATTQEGCRWRRENIDILEDLRQFKQTEPIFKKIDPIPVWSKPVLNGHQIQTLFNVSGPQIKYLQHLSEDLRDNYYITHQTEIPLPLLIDEIKKQHHS